MDNYQGRVGQFQPLAISAPHVDWFSATVKTRAGKAATTQHAIDCFMSELRGRWGGAFAHVTTINDLEPHIPMKRYWVGFQDRLTGAVFSIGGNTETVRIELTGQSCEAARWLTRHDGIPLLNCIINYRDQNTTRLDVCADLSYPVPPLYIAENRPPSRITISDIRATEDGWTVYIGSRESARCCRVYLYKQPHPRSGSSRIEFQLRDEYAEQYAQQLRSGQPQSSLYKRLVNTFSITFAAELLDSADYGKFTASKKKSPAPSKLRWLYEQVVPAISRMVKEDGFEIEDLINAINNHRLK